MQIRGLQDPPAARRLLVRVGQPRGLHEPRPDHHAAEGPLRRADPHALPARGRDRGGDRAPGGRPLEAEGVERHGARLHGRDRRHASPPRPVEPAHQPALGRVGAAHGHQPRDAGRQRRAPGAAPRRDATSCPASATSRRWRRRRPARSRSRRSRRAATAQIVENLLKAAVLTVFQDRFAPERFRADRRGVRRGRGRPRRRGRRVGRLRRRCSSSARRWRGRHRAHRRRRVRRAVAARSSSCSRACTSRSASTRTPSAPAPPTARGPEPEVCTDFSPRCGRRVLTDVGSAKPTPAISARAGGCGRDRTGRSARRNRGPTRSCRRRSTRTARAGRCPRRSPRLRCRARLAVVAHVLPRRWSRCRPR